MKIKSFRLSLPAFLSLLPQGTKSAVATHFLWIFQFFESSFKPKHGEGLKKMR